MVLGYFVDCVEFFSNFDSLALGVGVCMYCPDQELVEVIVVLCYSGRKSSFENWKNRNVKCIGILEGYRGKMVGCINEVTIRCFKYVCKLFGSSQSSFQDK